MIALEPAVLDQRAVVGVETAALGADQEASVAVLEQGTDRSLVNYGAGGRAVKLFETAIKLLSGMIILAFAWVVISASHAEGWGMSLTEGAACATPAVATDIAGHREAVVDDTGATLHIVCPRSVFDLRAVLQTM